jgi:uncharacterized protein
MRMTKKSLFILLALLLVASSSQVSAYKETGKIGLLTVAESANGTVQRGGVASLELDIKPGSGRIYIDSFPLSRLDTQITMRFASELACDFLQLDCSNLDFFYTIRADSSIVGGPSAGAAATVLTVAMLDDQTINEKVIMTGTINSGYLIGPVAGISQKTFAAQSNGYETALIPKWDALNGTENLTIKIIPVSTLEEALYDFTGKNYSKTYPPVVPSNDYTNVMKTITIDLCSKYGGFKNSTIVLPNISDISDISDVERADVENSDNASTDTDNESKDYFELALTAINIGHYYSAASYCFGGNVRIATALYGNLSNVKLKQEYAKLLGQLSLQEQDLKNRDISTISDLETYMIVKERLSDARDILRNENPDNISGRSIAYALERIDTASSWSKFFNIKSVEFDKKQDVLANACSKKISETEERINYLQVYYPREVDRTELNKAYAYSDSGDYALCIFTASKAKADVDVILGALFLNDNDVNDLLNEKLDATATVISRQQQSGLFPILGYSYYEYANSLKAEEPYSALLYAEYALELSNLDAYIGVQKQKVSIPFKINNIDSQYIGLFVLGFALGALLVVFFVLGYSRIAANKKNSKDAVYKNDMVHKRPSFKKRR